MDPMDRRGTGSSPGMMGSGPGGVPGSGGLGPGSGSQHHRSRSATRTSAGGGAGRSYGHSLDRDGHEREFMPIREGRDARQDMRDRSLERGMDAMAPGGGGGGRRDRSMDRGAMMDEDMLYAGRDMAGPGLNAVGAGGGLAMPRSARQSPAVDMGMAKSGPGGMTNREAYLMEIQAQNADLSRELQTLKRELEMTNQKLGSSMHSIKTFWSPELKKERALRKEESAKYSLINDQLKLLNAENQVIVPLLSWGGCGRNVLGERGESGERDRRPNSRPGRRRSSVRPFPVRAERRSRASILMTSDRGAGSGERSAVQY